LLAPLHTRLRTCRTGCLRAHTACTGEEQSRKPGDIHTPASPVAGPIATRPPDRLFRKKVMMSMERNLLLHLLSLSNIFSGRTEYNRCADAAKRLASSFAHHRQAWIAAYRGVLNSSRSFSGNAMPPSAPSRCNFVYETGLWITHDKPHPPLRYERGDNRWL